MALHGPGTRARPDPTRSPRTLSETRVRSGPCNGIMVVIAFPNGSSFLLQFSSNDDCTNDYRYGSTVKTRNSYLPCLVVLDNAVDCLFFCNAGGVSFVWWIFWNIFVYSSPETHPRISPVEKNYIMKTIGTVAYEHVSLAHAVLYIYWHWHEYEEQGLRNCLASVHPSHPTAARRCCRFAAVGPAGRRYRSVAALPACGMRMRALPRYILLFISINRYQ